MNAKEEIQFFIDKLNDNSDNLLNKKTLFNRTKRMNDKYIEGVIFGMKNALSIIEKYK